MSEHVLVGYSDLKGSKPDETVLVNTINLFTKNSTFHFLPVINNFVSQFSPINDSEEFIRTQRFLSKNLLDEELWNLTNEKLQGQTPLERPIFNRWQMLFLMKRLLLEGDDNGKVDPGEENAKEERYLLGKACLLINDFLTTKEQDDSLKSDDPNNESEKERILDVLLSQLFPTGELFNPPDIYESVVRVNKYLEISESFFPDFINGKSLSLYFESLSGVRLETFLELVLGINTWFISQNFDDLVINPGNFNLNRSTWFSTLDYSKKEIDGFFNLVSGDITKITAELKNLENKTLKSHYDFRAFRKYPLLFLTETSFTCIDYGVFTEKVLMGLYHTILNSLPEDKKIRRAFFQQWGKIFEIYINNIFRELFPESSYRFYPNTYFDTKSEKEAFDGVIMYPKALLAIEYKGGLLKSDAKYSGDIDLLLDDLNKKFGCKENDSGIKQLSTKITFLFNSNAAKRRRLRDVDLANITTVFPLLVVNEISLEFWLINRKLTKWFESEIDRDQLDKNITVKTLTLLTVEDLEHLSIYLDAGDFALLDYVEFYTDLIEKYSFNPETIFPEVFRKFRKSKNIKFRGNDKLAENFSNIVDKIIEKFKEQAHLSPPIIE